MIFKKIEAEFHPGSFKRYFTNTSWLFLENVIKILSSFVVGIFVIRYLGPDQYGTLSYAISFVFLFSALTQLGLDGIVIRELVKKKEDAENILGTAFALKAGGSLLAFLLICLSFFVLRDDTRTISITLFIALSFIFSPFNILDFYFQARVQSKYAVFARISQYLTSGVIKIIFICLNAPLFWFALIVVFESFILALVLVYNYIRVDGLQKKWMLNISLAKKLLRDALPLFFSAIAVSIYMKIDQVMIKHMLDVKQVGIYSSAIKICEAFYFIPIIISGSVFPAIIKTKLIDSVTYEKRMQQLFNFLVIVTYGIALPLMFWADDIIHFLFGVEYSAASSVLKIYLWTNVAVFLGVASGKWLIAENFTKISFYRTAIGAVINVLLNFLLIPKYQILGAAIATLISHWIATFSILCFQKTRECGYMIIKSLVPLRW